MMQNVDTVENAVCDFCPDAVVVSVLVAWFIVFHHFFIVFGQFHG